RDLSSLAASPLAIAIALVFVAGAGALVAIFPREAQPAVAAAGTTAGASAEAGATAGASAEAGTDEHGHPLSQPQVPADFTAQWQAAPREQIGVAADGAKVVIVKFNDYQCPACAQAHQLYSGIIKELQAANPGQ